MEKHPWGAGAVASGRREHTMNILLTGGAGYIDSQTAVALTEAGHRAGCDRPAPDHAGGGRAHPRVQIQRHDLRRASGGAIRFNNPSPAGGRGAEV